METDKVQVAVDLQVITHDGVKEHPFINVSFNGYPQYGEVTQEDVTVEFTAPTHSINRLTVEYFNKDPLQDVVVEQGAVVADKRIQITGIRIEDIALDLNTLDSLTYECNDPDGEDATGFAATKLSWNGRTSLQLTSPIYMWLLDNL